MGEARITSGPPEAHIWPGSAVSLCEPMLMAPGAFILVVAHKHSEPAPKVENRSQA